MAKKEMSRFWIIFVDLFFTTRRYGTLFCVSPCFNELVCKITWNVIN